MGARGLRGGQEDVVQETLLRALQSSASFQMDSDPWPWVRTIADRVAIRRSERERLAPGPIPESAAEPVARSADSAEEAESARALLARLQGPERHALERFYLDGMSVAEIAAADSSPPGTIKARLSRGRGRLLLIAGTSLGGALGIFAFVRSVGETAPHHPAEPTGAATLHYAWSTVRTVPTYEPKLRTIDLRPATVGDGSSVEWTTPKWTTVEWTVPSSH